MKNRFIVLIDLSPFSAHLLRFAYEWGRRAGAEMLVVHNTSAVTPLMTPHETKTQLIDMANKEAWEKLKTCTETTLPAGTSVRHLVSEKNLVTTLRPLLEERFFNVVFLGIKGTRLIKKFFIGSAAVHIIDSIGNLIVAIPPNAPCCAPDVIHVAIQKNYPLNILEFNKFLRLNGEEISKIVFFSVIADDDDQNATEKYLNDLTELYSEKCDVAYELYIGKNARKDLKKVIQQKQHEFIVVQKGSRMLLDSMFRKYLINELVYRGNTPLIIVP